MMYENISIYLSADLLPLARADLEGEPEEKKVYYVVEGGEFGGG